MMATERNDSKMIGYCRVCGLYNETFPWGEDGTCPTYEFCDCCGVEFGYEDYTVESAKEFREKWILEGAEWFRPEEKTINWSLEEQFLTIPESYR